jgi:hypothetical protein
MGTVHKLIQDRLEASRLAYEAGNLAGIAEAVMICQEWQIALPSWLVNALARLWKATARGEQKKGMGRHARWIEQYRQDILDYSRFEAVMEAREHGFKGDAAFEKAVKILGPQAWSIDAVKASFRRVPRRMKENPRRYFISRFIRTNM